MKRPGHEVHPADGADVRGPDERVATLELLDLRANGFSRPEIKFFNQLNSTALPGKHQKIYQPKLPMAVRQIIIPIPLLGPNPIEVFQSKITLNFAVQKFKK